jgi:hypothetical protein
MTPEKALFAKFTGPRMFLEQGRLLFSVLNVFASTGYRVLLHDNLGDKPLDKYGQRVFGLPGLELVRAAPRDPEGLIYLYDEVDRRIGTMQWRKKVQVRFDLFSPFRFSDPIIMPFPMHPLQSGVTAEQLNAHRSAERRLRVFFSGDTNHYGRNWVRYPKPKMPRLQIVQALSEELGGDTLVIGDPAELDALRSAGYTNKCVLTASSDVRIEPEEWLGTLAMADFFLSPPGIVMPMCHNIIEAMAVGTIPITNYPEWLDPHLEHMENCIVFDDRADLVAKLHAVLQMGNEEIVRLRRNVLRYYDAYMTASTFVRRVEQHRDRTFPILIYTERNMAKNPAKLRRNSILMRGTTVPREKGWVARTASSFLGK